MYSGTTLTVYSGRLMGTHQKIDRVARANLEKLLPGCKFPSVAEILHFEGGNGPDAIKRKSPSQDEPWHFILPYDENDKKIIDLIEEHYRTLVAALKKEDEIRASFEAAWLAHAVVDGLTPAHHYPYHELLAELMKDRDLDEKASVKGKIVMPGDTAQKQVRNNWKMWGPKGLFLTHTGFELGVGMLMAPMRLSKSMPAADTLVEFKVLPLSKWFRRVAQKIARMELYDMFYRTGWTIPLARQVRRQLAPLLVESVTLVWYGAAIEADKVKARK
jgi:hypothetical protein